MKNTQSLTVKSIQKIQASLLEATCIAALLCSVPAALAQTNTQTGAQTNTSEQADENQDSQTIVVTATRRSESIQTVGLSITAVSGEALQDRGVAEFEDFATTIPNLAFGATDDGILANRTISIRGIEGLNTTGFYIDDVPLDESVSPLVLDVERIEVLRGPQGTLYGARGLGGTVRIITKQPEFDFLSGRVHAKISSVDEGGVNYAVDGSLNIPVGNFVAVRTTAYYDKQSGIFDRVVGSSISPGVGVADGTVGALVGDARTVRNNVDDRETYGGLVALRIQPSEALNIVARVMGQRTKIDGFPLADFAFDPNNPPTRFVLAADDFTQERLFDVPESGTDKWYQASLNISYDTGIGTLSSSTGYFDRKTQESEDTSEFISFTLLGTILPGAGLPTMPTAIRSPIFQELNYSSFAQELRFVSDFGGAFQITTGFFYQDTDDDEAFKPDNIAPGFDAAFSTQLSGGIPTTGLSGFGDLIFRSNRPFNVKELGVYGEVSLDLTDRLTLTAGARYFDVKTEFSEFQEGFAVGSTNTIGPLESSENGVNLKFLAEYEVNDDLYLYASAAEGFRIGGANGDLPGSLGCPAQAQAIGIDPADAVTFGSDGLWSYEGGVKSTFSQGKATVNASVFYVDFTRIQQRVLLQCGFGFIANIGAARSQGFEIESSVRPIKGMALGLNIGYTDAQFTQTVAGIVNAGDLLQQIPKWTISASGDYEFAITDSVDMFWRGDIAFVDSSVSRVVDSASPRIRPDYVEVNVRFGVKFDDFEITAFLDNALNENAVYADNRTLAAEAGGRPRIVRNRPRTIGLEIQKEF